VTTLICKFLWISEKKEQTPLKNSITLQPQNNYCHDYLTLLSLHFTTHCVSIQYPNWVCNHLTQHSLFCSALPLDATYLGCCFPLLRLTTLLGFRGKLLLWCPSLYFHTRKTNSICKPVPQSGKKQKTPCAERPSAQGRF